MSSFEITLMNLYLLRHAKAEELGATDSRRDCDRALQPEGIKRMRRVAGGMAALELRFDAILSSPFVRAKQTAEIVTKTFACPKKLQLLVALEPDSDPDDTVEYLRQFRRGSDDVLLVGHEPHLSRLVSALVAGGSALGLNFKKAGLCKLSVGLRRRSVGAQLEWLLTPRQLDKLAGK